MLWAVKSNVTRRKSELFEAVGRSKREAVKDGMNVLMREPSDQKVQFRGLQTEKTESLT